MTYKYSFLSNLAIDVKQSQPTLTMTYQSLFILSFWALLVSSQQVDSDPHVYGPPIELVHIYNDQFPSGIKTHQIMTS